MKIGPIFVPRLHFLVPTLFVVTVIPACRGGDGASGDSVGDAASAPSGVPDGGSDVRPGVVDLAARTENAVGPDAPTPGDRASGADASPDMAAWPVLPVQHKSGTRLRATVHVTEAGEQIFSGWFDPTMNSPCAPGLLADGSTVCVPTRRGTGGTAYADPECKTPIFFSNASTPEAMVPTLISTEAITGCGKVIDLFRPGAPRDAGEMYGWTPAGACAKASPFRQPTVVRPLTRVDAKEFVAFRVVRDRPAGARLSLSRLVFEDGAEQVWGYFDETEMVSCQPAGMTDKSLRCVPRSRFSRQVGSFSDSACTVPLATGIADPTCRLLSGAAREVLSDTQSFVEDSGGAPCETATSLFEAKVAPAPVTNRYMTSGATTSCSAALGPSAAGAFAVPGATIPPERLVPLRSSLVGRGRLARETLVSDEGLVLSQPGVKVFWDRELGVECAAFSGFPSVQNRCVPDATRSTSVIRGYSDAACTKPVAIDVYFLGCGARGVSPRFMFEYAANPVHVWRLGSRVAPEPETVFLAQTNGTCQGRPRGMNESVWEIREEILVTTLPMLSQRTE